MDSPQSSDSLDPKIPSKQSGAFRVEKPLPPVPPPFDRTTSEAPVLSAVNHGSEGFSHGKRPSSSNGDMFLRPRKRVLWRNRGCIIALPIDNDFGKKTTREKYLSPEDVARSLREWEDKGYDTRGFLLAPPSPGFSACFSECQSREVHPDAGEEEKLRIERDYRVSIPDLGHWEAYVSRLKEEKLRALGVSSGDEDPARMSAAPSLMSRQASSQSSGMVTSPALGPPSVHGAPYSPGFQAPTNFNPRVGKTSVSHFPRYSMAMPLAERAFSPSNQFSPPPQSPNLHAWSAHHHLGSQPGSRVGSPNKVGHIHKSNGSVSPLSSAQTGVSQFAGHDAGEMLHVMRWQQAAGQAQHSQQQQQQHHHQKQMPLPGSLLPAKPQSLSLASAHHTTIASPIPLGHHQFPLDTLQEDVGGAGLPGVVLATPMTRPRNLATDDQVSLSERNASVIDVRDGPSADGRMVESIPGFDSNFLDAPDNIGHQDGLLQPEDVSKKPASKLNVNAPEFKFEPKTAIDQEVFAFLGSQEPMNLEVDSANSAVEGSGCTRSLPDGAPHTTKLNVEAPEFKPTAVARNPMMPSREFSFSASLPTFRPDAPTFKPSDSHAFSGSDTSNKENSVDAVKKIFGEIKFSEAIKPARKSRAIPIIKPTGGLDDPDNKSHDSDGQEDESGRITQADGRQKRMRRDFDDGDQVPLFASPTQDTLKEDGDSDGASYFSRTTSPDSEEAHNATLEAATDLLEEIIDDLSATEASDLMREEDSASGEGKPFEPHFFNDIDDAASFNAARPPVSPQGQAARHLEPSPNDVARATMDFLGKSPQYKADFDQALERRISGSQFTPLEKLEKEDGIDRMDHAPRNIMDGVRYLEPSYNELDAIMRHLNEDSDHGVERRPSPFKRRGLSMSPVRSSAPEHHHMSRSPVRDSTQDLYDTPKPSQLLPPAKLRSDAPAPSPNRLRGMVQYKPPTDTESANTSAVENIDHIAREIANNPLDSPSWPSKNAIPVHRLNSPGSSPPSDWNDAISSLDEDKFRSRTGFFDNRVNDLVGNVVQQRLGPLEQALSGIQQSLALLSARSASRRPRSSGTIEIVNSDADDEEDAEEASQSRVKSPLRDRRLDQLKSTISEMNAVQQTFASSTQLAEVMGAVKDLKECTSHASTVALNNAGDIRTIVEEAVGKQLRGRSAPVTSTSVAAVAERSQLQIAGLESMLKVAENRADDELKARRSTEDALADTQRLLRSALQEASEQRESAEATECSLEGYSEERQEMLQRNAMLEQSEENLQKTISCLTDKNAALEDILAEYRLSSDQWRTEIDDARHENKELRRNIGSLNVELDESNENRQALRSKLNGLQEEMSQAMQEAADDRSKWNKKDQEHSARLGALDTRLEAEARTRDRLQVEIELQEQEVARAQAANEQIKLSNHQLQATVAELRSECYEHQQNVSRFEHGFHDMQTSTMIEIQQTRTATAADVEAATEKAALARAESESIIAGLRTQIEKITVDADDAKARHDLMLRETTDLRSAALREATDVREAALQEHDRLREQTTKELRAQHERAINNAIEDKERSETYLGNRLNLADEKVSHYQDRVNHLEEKLDIAKSAAHAAVQAVQAKKPTTSLISARSTKPNIRASDIPEKISPQALRESILVLQEQLQERESRIERLQSEISSLDTTAPAKLKDAEIEITWLRELLGVRIDDLEDIISTLSQPAYNREAVKDAAIRLKANLQMEQQEKERAFAGGQSFPSLASISNLAASPKALPLAAAAAWGNWRKGREGLGSMNAVANGSVHETPSKSSPQSFFAGLMTPPSTSMRTTPPIMGNSRPLSTSTSKRLAPTTPRQSLHSRNDSRLQQNPVTPPLMRKASYDLDASESVSGFGDEGIEGSKMAGEDDEPFGPRLGGIVGSM